MNPIALDRRHPYLLNPQGDPLIPSVVMHDRRRKKMVEDLLKAMRIRAAKESQDLQLRQVRHALDRHRIWLVLLVSFIAVMLVGLFAWWMAHSAPVKNQYMSEIALYEWAGFHRVALAAR